MIPKIIIQTWKTHDLPPYYKKTQNLLFRNNPDYRYIFFDDEAILKFVRDRYPSFEDTLKSFKRKIQVIDFFRLLAVYEYGGFYFDMDVEVISNLDPLLKYSCVFPVEMKRNNRVLASIKYDFNLGNYAFGASPRNPVIWKIIQEIVNVTKDPRRLLGHGIHSKFVKLISDISPESSQDLSHEYVYHTTGPVLVSKVIFDAMAEGDSVKLLYPKNWPSRSSWFRFGDYAKHTMTGTWKPNKEGVINEKGYELDYIVDRTGSVEKVKPSTASDVYHEEDDNKNNKEESDTSSSSLSSSTSTYLGRLYEGFGISGIWNTVSTSTEHMTVSDMVADPETFLILIVIIAIIIVLLILCSLSLIGCDEVVEIV